MKIYIFLIAIYFTSCTGSNKETENKITGNTLDTNAVAPDISATFDEKTFKPLSLPLTIDTTFILKSDSSDRISFEQIRSLRGSFSENDLSHEIQYDINTFCKIDSLKEIEKYQAYVEKLDIGMTKNSIAYKIGVINFKNNLKLFIWGLTSGSYEACPFYNGTSVMGTFVNEANQNTHFLIGEISAGGDPPSMGSKEITAKINTDSKIELFSVDVSDDLDIPGENIIRQKLILQLDKSGITVIDLKKEITTGEKATQ